MSSPRRILAIDFGDRRTGLAATDWTGTIVVPLAPIVADDDATVARQIAALVRERDTELVVVGLPLSRDGTEGPRAQRTQSFVAVLSKQIGIPIETIDESLSTDEAHQRLKALGLKAAQRKKLADSVAALVILERYRARP